MALAYINISTRQYVNFMCRTDFERRIFHDTYRTFQEKSATYCTAKGIHTFAQMCEKSLKAKVLHENLDTKARPAINSLNHEMPVLNDTEGNAILFQQARLNIHSSDLMNKANHVVTITYTSPKLVLHEMVNDLLILSYDIPGRLNQTFMLSMSNQIEILSEPRKVLSGRMAGK